MRFHEFIKIPYFTLFLIIIWDPLRAYLLSFDGSGFVYFGIILLGFINELKYKRFLNRLVIPPINYWLLWVVYVLINTFIVNEYLHSADPITFIFSILVPLFAMVLIMNRSYPLDKLLEVVIFSFLIRILLSLIFDSISVLGSDTVSRLGEGFNANAIAFGGYFLIFLLVVKKFILKNVSFVNYVEGILAILIIVLTASRKTTIALLILLFGIAVITRSRDKIKSFFQINFRLILLLSIALIVLNFSSVGARLKDSFEKTKNAQSDEQMFDSRMAQYIQGEELFLENPVLGIGLYNFGYVGDLKITAHSEYIVQFAETGLIGVSFFIFFYGNLIKKIWSLRKYGHIRKIMELFVVFLFSMFFLMSGAWIYNMGFYWVIIGFMIRYLHFQKSEISLSY